MHPSAVGIISNEASRSELEGTWQKIPGAISDEESEEKLEFYKEAIKSTVKYSIRFSMLKRMHDLRF